MNECFDEYVYQSYAYLNTQNDKHIVLNSFIGTLQSSLSFSDDNSLDHE